jgi:hypothetical protein
VPGPPVGTILTSNDAGLGTFEMKVKGTFVLLGTEKYLISKFLFTSQEEEDLFMERNPLYKKGGNLDLNDAGKSRGRNIPHSVKDQTKDGIMSKGEEIKPGDKPKLKKTPSMKGIK